MFIKGKKTPLSPSLSAWPSARLVSERHVDFRGGSATYLLLIRAFERFDCPLHCELQSDSPASPYSNRHSACQPQSACCCSCL